MKERAKHHGAHEDSENETERQFCFMSDVESEIVALEACLPSVEPDSWWLSFNAGNLKKMNKKSDPSKKPDTSARIIMLRSRRIVRRAEVEEGAGTASSC